MSENLNRVSTGMKYVLVNGIPAIDGGKITDALPGKAFAGPASRATSPNGCAQALVIVRMKVGVPCCSDFFSRIGVACSAMRAPPALSLLRSGLGSHY